MQKSRGESETFLARYRKINERLVQVEIMSRRFLQVKKSREAMDDSY